MRRPLVERICSVEINIRGQIRRCCTPNSANRTRRSSHEQSADRGSGQEPRLRGTRSARSLDAGGGWRGTGRTTRCARAAVDAPSDLRHSGYTSRSAGPCALRRIRCALRYGWFGMCDPLRGGLPGLTRSRESSCHAPSRARCGRTPRHVVTVNIVRAVATSSFRESRSDVARRIGTTNHYNAAWPVVRRQRGPVRIFRAAPHPPTGFGHSRWVDAVTLGEGGRCDRADPSCSS